MLRIIGAGGKWRIGALLQAVLSIHEYGRCFFN